MNKKIKNLEELYSFADIFAKQIKSNTLVLFSGELGAGKTTFIKALCQKLGVKEMVTSPTFTLVQNYQAKLPIFHLDLYRLETEKEIINMDIFNFLDEPNALVLVEWGEKLLCFKDLEYIMLEFHIISENKRELNIVGNGKKYQEMIKNL